MPRGSPKDSEEPSNIFSIWIHPFAVLKELAFIVGNSDSQKWVKTSIHNPISWENGNILWGGMKL